MSAHTLISRLHKVKRTGAGRWIAACPSHPDKHPSMGVRELDDGRVLVRCYSGCSVEEILGALASNSSSVPAETDRTREARTPAVHPDDVFEIARMEISVVAIIAADMHKGRPQRPGP